eukprot:2478941-Amphidinium_carterae.1
MALRKIPSFVTLSGHQAHTKHYHHGAIILHEHDGRLVLQDYLSLECNVIYAMQGVDDLIADIQKAIIWEQSVEIRIRSKPSTHRELA